MGDVPSSRVYYTGSRGSRATLVALALAVSLWLPGCFAQTASSLTIDPAMTRGPATAPVTIVEFSDYQ